MDGITILAYNPDYDFEQGIYAIIFVLIMVYNFRVGFVKVFGSDSEEDGGSYTEEYYKPSLVVADVRKRNKEPFNKGDWDEICRMAIDNAKEGDHRARDWVMKNVVVSNSAKDSNSFDPTPKSVLNDAVETLRSMGHTKKDAVDLVKAATKLRKYDSVESLVRDVYKKG
jgi:hypothetical protein